MMGDVFSRQNVVNAMMPKPIASGVNSVLDMVAAARERKKEEKEAQTSSKEEKKPRQVQEEEEDFDPSQGGWVEDDEYDDEDDGPSAAAMDIDGSLDEIEEDEIYMSVNKNNPYSLKTQLNCGAYIFIENEDHYFTRIKI